MVTAPSRLRSVWTQPAAPAIVPLPMLRRLLPAALAILSCDASAPEPSASPIAAPAPEPAAPATTAASASPTTPAPPPVGSTAAAHVEEITATLRRIDEAVLTELALDAASDRVRCRIDGAGGCVIEEIAADSIVHALGLRHGDRLQRVAGVEVTDAASLRAALLGGRGLGVIEAAILRGGTTLRLRYRLRTAAALRPADEEREKGLDVLGEAIAPGADGAVVIDVAALPSLAGALQGRRATKALPRILGLGALQWTRLTRDGETTTPGSVVPRTAVDGVVEALVGGREVTFGFADEHGAELRAVRMTAREDVVDPTIIALAASLLDTPASASSLDTAPPDPAAPAIEDPLPPFEGITTISDTEATITRAALDALIADPMTLAKAGRIVPSPEGGMKLYGIRRSSDAFSWGRLGLRNGDRVVAINGFALDGAEAALEIYSKLRKAAEFRVTVDRRGTELELLIRVVE